MSDSARPARMSTITDVAREAGVSVATVSRALRGLDRVSPETREKVLQVAEELNYMASPTATSLASGRTEIVGVVAPFLTRWFFASLVSAIEKSLRARGHHVLLFDLEDESYDSRLHLSQNLLWRRVDGVITLNLPMTDEELALLDRLALPAVAIGTPMPGHPCVRIDDADAMRQATEHLISQGHRRIAYIGAVPGNVAHVLTPQGRRRAFEETLAAHGIPLREEWVLNCDWTADAAAEHTSALLTCFSAAERPTAIVAASDEMAFGAMAAAHRLGLHVPDDLSVVGIDDHTLSNVLGLTTVRQDVEAQGQVAADLLLGALLDDQPLDPSVMTYVPTELVVRDSVAPLR